MKGRAIHIIALALLVALSSAFFRPVTDPIEQQVLDVRYALRGPLPADTNIVILYFDNDDIAALGGWPLRRNYYALLIDVLDHVGAAAVGIDVFFGERSLEYPQYDELLAALMAKSGNVVLASYFRELTDAATPSEAEGTDYTYGGFRLAVHGNRLQLPAEDFLRSAASVGHANFQEPNEHEVPLFVGWNGRSFPAFGLELLRVYEQTERSNVHVSADKIELHGRTGKPAYRIGRRSIKTDAGRVRVNFPGALSSFRSYRCVEVLRSFELRRAGLSTSIDLTTLSGKIVLLGVIAEGSSKLVQSPFTPSFPAIALHATVLDNALNDRFLQVPSSFAITVVSAMVALIVALLLVRLGPLKGIVATLGVLLLYLVIGQVLFNQFAFALPLVQPFIVVVVFVVAAIVVEHQSVRRRMRVLEEEKVRVESGLRERELRLQVLEQELLDASGGSDGEREVELLEQIKRYKKEVRELAAKVTDLVEYPADEGWLEGGVVLYEGIVYDRRGPMAEVVQMIAKISGSDANVLILGESGTGKEVVARAIHQRSARRNKPFVALNCGAIPETLLESELFGHERGAFTGAVQDKVGRFEYADGGTMFLDEVAETSEAFQVKLLRVVQYGEFERVGSSVTRKANVRILAAINKDVKELIRQRKFREDLYYRLNVFTVQLPPLRERKGDIPLLVHHFVEREGKGLSVSSTVMDAFLQYSWPGNVRELESVVKRAAILAHAEGRTLIRMKDIPAELSGALNTKGNLEDQILESLREKKFSQNAISKTAAELGGMNRGTVAEHFRGTCFKYFFESAWNLDRAVAQLANSNDGEIVTRVRKKLTDYLGNVVDGIQPDMPFAEAKRTLKSKTKNLPQRYHIIVEETVRAFIDGKWRLNA